MAKAKVDTVESVIASANKAGAPRQYVGNPPAVASARNTSSDTANQGLDSADPYHAAADPAVSPYLLTARPHVSATETKGAAYAIKATINKPVDPVSAPTMANAKIIPAVIQRVSPDFRSASSAV